MKGLRYNLFSAWLLTTRAGNHAPDLLSGSKRSPAFGEKK
jgi:hypothetical protein